MVKIPALKKDIREYFPLVAHNYQEIPEKELDLVKRISDATFEKRIVGLERVIQFRNKNPKAAIVLVSNHFSEADFIETALLFYRYNTKLLIQAGDNLFIDSIKIKKKIRNESLNVDLNIDFNLGEYLRSRGAFQVLRKPKEVMIDGELEKLGDNKTKKINIRYLLELIKNSEMILQYASESSYGDEVKTGRAYEGKIDSFSIPIFKLLVDAAKSTEKEIQIIPMTVSYESILEDMLFRELKKMKERGASDEEIYRKDLHFIVRKYLSAAKQNIGEYFQPVLETYLWDYEIPTCKCHLCMKFGDPIAIKVEGFKNGLWYKRKDIAEELASKIWEVVKKRKTPFAPNVFFTAMIRDMKEMRIEISRLKYSISKVIEELGENNADMHYIEGKSPDQISDRTLEIFGEDGKGVISEYNGYVKLYRYDVAVQYMNHISHFFEEKKE